MMLVDCHINNSEKVYHFMIDTGALFFIDKSLADELNLKQQGPMAKIDKLVMDQVVAERIFAMTTFPLKMIKQSSGITLHGIIGSNFLERYVVHFDYKKKQMTLRPPDHFTQDMKDQAGFMMKFQAHVVNRAPMIPCTLNGQIEVLGMVDTGQPFALALPLSFREKGINKSNKSIVAKGYIIKWPGTSSQDNVLTTLDQLAFGKNTLDKPVIVLAELPPMLSVPLIGADVLSQFLVTIDYEHQEIYFKPVTEKKWFTTLYSIGLNLEENDQGEIEVKGVWDHSAANEAGIVPGDLVLAFNNIPLNPANFEQLSRLLADSSVQSLQLLIKTSKGNRKVLLQKGSLL